MKPYQTLDKFEEKVYTVNSGDSEDEIKYQVELFMQELLTRKRNDKYEGGLQASMVIYPDKAGFKVAEKGGMAVHAHTEETLAQYLDGETLFSSFESMRRPGIKNDDPHSAFGLLDRHCITNRVVAGQDSILFAFVSHSEEPLTRFQLSVMEQLANIAKKAIELGLIEDIGFGVHTNDVKIEFDDSDTIDPGRCAINLGAIEKFLRERKVLAIEKGR